MRTTILAVLLTVVTMTANAQAGLKKVYDENIDPMEQIDKAVANVESTDKYIICQVGGNWCPWCLRFADFISKDSDIMKVINDNFVYLHVNYNPRKGNSSNAAALMKRLNNPQRFGFPVFVVLDNNGKVIHIQDSSFLEEGKSYNKENVLRFLNAWTPKAVNQTK